MIKKLIEVALPLEAINIASAREKSIRHGHPSTLHLWWARRPLATARAVIFSSLVDDPSSHPEEFPTEEDQAKERKRLFDLIEKLVLWENSNNQALLSQAKKEIMKSTGGNPPELLDPFAGGGAIPLEGQRLGLVVHASDLNPVAVMINKAMIEIPPKFASMPPVNPEARQRMTTQSDWQGTKGLADDVRYYGEWLRDEAFKQIGHLYPKVKVPKEQGGGEATVIAWIWARTVKCPNPACGCEMPLARAFELSKKKGKEAFILPIIEGKNIKYEVKYERSNAVGTVNRNGAICIRCGTPVAFQYIRNESVAGRMSARVIAVVAESKYGRLYLSPDNDQQQIAKIDEPEDCPQTELPSKALGFGVQIYGMTKHKDLFTNRQLISLTTASDLVSKAQKEAYNNAVATGLNNDYIPLSKSGKGATAYSEAIGLYLAFIIDKIADRHSTLASWDISRDGLRNTFSKQALQMTWDFAEANPFSNSTGCYDNTINWITKCIIELPTGNDCVAVQHDAAIDNGLREIMVSTDPPYYDNIDYSDLSDFFYIWLRRSLSKTYPDIFNTLLVPKAEELIATPFRFDGSKEKARDFFENGMLRTFEQVYIYARDDVPVTIYYAFKQSETEADEDSGLLANASTGWETMLTAIIKAGFAITGTWPMRTELANRTRNIDSNALASSIILVCRKRISNAPVCTRRDFINELKRELKPALHELQKSNIAPVDLAQSAIGPGMAVFSKYSKVLESDGSAMGVRSALQLINQEMDSFYTEQEGELDRDSRFCVELYSQYAFNNMKYGEADVLARAKNTSIEKLADRGVLSAQKGVVCLLPREELPEKVHEDESIIWLLTQQLTHAMETGGVKACAEIIAPIFGSNAEFSKALAYRLFTIAERKGWAGEAFAYNSLVIAWPEIQSKAAEINGAKPEQLKLF